jgi:hypothetical protein
MQPRMLYSRRRSAPVPAAIRGQQVELAARAA